MPAVLSRAGVRAGRLAAYLFVALSLAAPASAQIVINEIMYHPPAPWPATLPSRTTNLAEYIEIYNAGTSNVDLSTYRFDNGVDYAFDEGTVLGTNGYLVVCLNKVAFTNAYPGVTNYVGNYGGGLANGGERVTLSRRQGGTGAWETVDTIAYLDVGRADGDGPSLEQVNPGFAPLRNHYFGAWKDSTSTNGTPGRANSVYTNKTPPVVGDVRHDPPLPFPDSMIAITAIAKGPDTNPINVTLRYRVDTLARTNVWKTRAMYDDGRNGDAVAGDYEYTARVPEYNEEGFADKTLLEYQIVADNLWGSLTYPATNYAGAKMAGPFTYLCYFGSDTNYDGEYPTYHLLLTASNAAGVEAQTEDNDSDLRDGTLITGDGKIYYNCAIRHRGGSSTYSPFNYKVRFPNGMDLDGLSSMDLNHVNAQFQFIGMTIAGSVGYGCEAEDVQLCRVWLNDVHKSPSASQRIYVRHEPLDQDFAVKHYNSDNGNFYSNNRDWYNGRLDYPSTNLSDYWKIAPSRGTYAGGYLGDTNNPYTAWHDLTNLCWILDQPQATLPTLLSNRILPRQWARYFGAQIAIDNDEAGVNVPTDVPDDELRLYVGTENGLFYILPHDCDSILGGNGSSVWDWNTSYNINDVLRSSACSNFYAHDCRDIVENIMSVSNMNVLFDSMGSILLSSDRTTWLGQVANQRTGIQGKVGTGDAGPVAPSNLFLTNATASTIELRWTDNSSDELWFEIERSKNGQNWKYIDYVWANVRGYTNSLLDENTEYFYRVRAVDVQGESAYTEPKSATTLFITTSALLRNNLRITEIMYHHSLHDDNYDYLELYNIGGAGALDVGGVQISGVGGYTFPTPTSLGAGGYLVVCQKRSDFTNFYPAVTNLAPGEYSGKLSEAGEQIELVHTNSGTLLKVTYSDQWYSSTDGNGYSLVLSDPAGTPNDPTTDAMSNPDLWRPSTALYGSPGSNDPTPPWGVVLINEALTHQDAEDPGDWIELYNPATTSVSISGWFLSDSTNLMKFRIPNGTTIGAGGYRVFNERYHFGTNGLAGTNGFALSELGEAIYLSSGDASTTNLTSYRIMQDFGAASNSVTFGRYTRSDGETDFVPMSRPTMSNANAYPMVGPVVINEIMYNPAAGGHEFVELRNVTNYTVNLYDTEATNGWRFDGAMEYAFPTNASIAPGEVVVVAGIAPALFRAAFGLTNAALKIYGPFAGDLANNGESVKFYKPSLEPDGTVAWIRIDRVQYDDEAPWPVGADNAGPSLERIDPLKYGNDPTNWVAATPGGTPCSANNTNGLASVNFLLTGAWAYETNQAVKVAVVLSRPLAASTVTVSYAVSGGTASNLVDYSVVGSSLTFTNGQTTNFVTLNISNDVIAEADETVQLALLTIAGNARIGGNAGYTYTIVDTDGTNTIETPQIGPPGKFFFNSVVVTMRVTNAELEIFYTTDGSTPTRSDKLYTNQITLTASARVKARAFLGTRNCSPVATETYSEKAPLWDLGPGSWRGVVESASDDANEKYDAAMETQAKWLIRVPLGDDTQNSSQTGKASYAGFRFAGVNVPAGVTLTNAYIQFTVYPTNRPMADTGLLNTMTNPIGLVIRGEKTNNAVTFGTANSNLSSRARTSAAVAWLPPVWTNANDAGGAQCTPNLTGLVYEVMTETAWQQSNALSFVFVYALSNRWSCSARWPWAFEGNAGKAASLTLQWSPVTEYWLGVATNAPYMGVITGGNRMVSGGTTATVWAVSNSSYYYFQNWSGDTNGGNINAASYSVLMDRSRQLVGNFGAVQYWLGAATNAPYMGTITGGNRMVTGGTTGTVWAVSNAGYYYFQNWSGDTTGGNTNAVSYSVLMDRARQLTGNFAAALYWLGVTTNEPQMGSITGGNRMVTGGTTATVWAVTNTYYYFRNWSGETTGGNTNAATYQVFIDRARQLTGNFGEVLTGSGTPHWWLGRHYPGTNDFENASLSDTDGDGAPAWAERRADTVPTNAASVFKIKAVGDSGTVYGISWLSVTSRTYRVTRGTNLLGNASWEELANGMPGTASGTNRFEDTKRGSSSYYRVEILGP